MQKRGLSLWPVRPRPLTGESFSSWLYRLSFSNSAKIHTFTSVALPRRQIWNRDIDSFYDTATFSVLSNGTGVPVAQLQSTTLQSYEGIVLERVITTGFSPFVLPLGLYHRIRKGFGSQYCPLCLDVERPYARLSWRMAWNTCFQEHGCLLRDRCHRCAHPFVFHRKGYQTCWHCDADLRRAKTRPVNSDALLLESELHAALEGDHRIAIRLNAKHVLVAFNVLHDLMSMVAYGKRSQAFRAALIPDVPDELIGKMPSYTGGYGFERLDVQFRHLIMAYCERASQDWPMGFVKAACEANLWRSWILRERSLDAVPFPLASLLGTLVYPDHASLAGTKHLRHRA